MLPQKCWLLSSIRRSRYTDNVRVRVLFFGSLRELAGKASEEIELRDGSALRDVLTHYQTHIPRLKDFLSSLALAVNQQYASPDTMLKPDDEIALLPPVSGGAQDATPSGTETMRQYATITRERINSQRVLESLKHGDDGAAVVFEGVVRNQTRGRKTVHLEYEAYEQMALQQMESLASQALGTFQIRDVAIVHRLGHLEIGEISVLIVVVSAHRGPAFDACRWLIDTLKRKVPIWKKEFFEDGAVWADGEPFPEEIPRANS
jgi:molybdopterin converting factor subunit 1